MFSSNNMQKKLSMGQLFSTGFFTQMKKCRLKCSFFKSWQPPHSSVRKKRLQSFRLMKAPLPPLFDPVCLDFGIIHPAAAQIRHGPGFKRFSKVNPFNQCILTDYLNYFKLLGMAQEPLFSSSTRILVCHHDHKNS